MDTKDKYKGLRAAILSQTVRTMKEIAEMQPTALALQLGMNHSAFLNKMYNPEELKGEHLVMLSHIVGVPLKNVIEIWAAELQEREEKVVVGFHHSKKKRNK